MPKAAATKVSKGHYKYRGFDIYNTVDWPWMLRNSWEFDAKNPWYTRYPEEFGNGELGDGEWGLPECAPSLRSMKYCIDWIWSRTSTPEKYL